MLSPPFFPPPKTIIVIFSILICALMLRLYHLETYDLWFDELGSDTFSAQNLARISKLSGTSPLSLMLDKIKHDPHSPFYYLCVYLYSFLFGDDTSLRILSVFFSMLSLGVFYKLSRLFFDQQTSIYALFILAFNPFHLWYAQEARAYAMACFFSLLMIYVYMQALKTNNRIYWTCFPLTGLLALFSSYHSASLLMASGVALFYKENRRYSRKWVLSLLIIFLCSLLLRPVITGHLSFVKNSFWLQAPSRHVLLWTWRVFTLGYSATMVQYSIGLTLSLALLLWGVYSHYRAHKAGAVILLSFLLLPMAGIYIFSWTITPIYLNRQLLIFSPFYYLLIANGIENIHPKRAQALTVVGVTVLVTFSLVNYYRGFMFADGRQAPLIGANPKKNYSGLMAYMSSELKKGDFIAAADLQSYVITRSYFNKYFQHNNDTSLEKTYFLFYPKELEPFARRFLGIDKLVEGISADNFEKLYSFVSRPSNKGEIKKIQFNNGKIPRVWLVSSIWTKEGCPLEQNSIKARNYMMQNFKRVLSRQKDGIYIELFTSNASPSS